MPKILDYVAVAVSIGLYLLIAWVVSPPLFHRAGDVVLAIPWIMASLFVPYAWLGLTQYALLGVHVRLRSTPLWVDLFFDRPRTFRMMMFALLAGPTMIQLAVHWHG